MIKRFLAKRRAKRRGNLVAKAQKAMIVAAKKLQTTMPGSTLTLIVNDHDALYEINKPWEPIDLHGRTSKYDN